MNQNAIISQNNDITVNSENSKTDDNWLVNLTDVVIPDKINNILKLGEKFCIPTSVKFIPFVHIIANVEGSLLEINDSVFDKSRLRNEFVNILSNFKNRSRHKQILNPTESKFIRDAKACREFVKDHPEIIITRADKGNSTVIVSKDDYINKISSMLQDDNTYHSIEKNSTKCIERKLNLLVTTWQKQRKITEYQAKSLRSYHGVTAKLYGLPKIHKPNTPYRPIVSSIGTPLYQLSSFLSQILNKTVCKSRFNVKNSTEFKERIKDIILPNDYIILSLDVVSLFTNIDSKLALHLIGERWN